MEENRSFDHMFGYYPGMLHVLYAIACIVLIILQGVNGLTGKESNLLDPSNPKSTVVTVNKDQPQIALCDPDHTTPTTTIKIFGAAAAKYVFPFSILRYYTI